MPLTHEDVTTVAMVMQALYDIQDNTGVLFDDVAFTVGGSDTVILKGNDKGIWLDDVS